MRICLTSRELAPFGGGGIGVYVANLARLLADVAEVTIITMAAFRPPYERLLAEGDPRVDSRVRVVFLDEPPDAVVADYSCFQHAWGAALLEAIREIYASGAPHLIEFPDYQAEGTVAIQAKRALDPLLRDTTMCVRAHCNWELCTLLDGHLPSSIEAHALCDLERYALRHADFLLWAGGDILGTYRRYYREALAPAVRVRHPLDARPQAGHSEWEDPYPIRFLYTGRLERRKGLLELVTALLRNPSDAWTLTLVGGDTETAPLGMSMRGQLELMTLGDERFTVSGPRPREELVQFYRDHDVVAMPSAWECWPYSVLEALQGDRPVLGTPTGGLTELVRHGDTGWLARDTTPEALVTAIEPLLDHPEQVHATIRSGRCRDHAAELSDPKAIVDSYVGLAQPPTPRPARRRPAGRRPLVSAVIPFKRTPDHLLEAVDSLLTQTYRDIEVIIVDDGSFAASDRVLKEAARRPKVRVLHQVNGGLGAARNAGIAQSLGKYLFPLDADNVAEPSFVARAVEILELDPMVAYVTCWSRYVDVSGADIDASRVIGYQPIGNEASLVARRNVAGDAAAVWPRRLWDLGFRYSEDVPVIHDWMLYSTMARAGRYGVVLPERLIRYRVRSDSMFRAIDERALTRLREELTTRLAIQEVQWTSSSV